MSILNSLMPLMINLEFKTGTIIKDIEVVFMNQPKLKILFLAMINKIEGQQIIESKYLITISKYLI